MSSTPIKMRGVSEISGVPLNTLRKYRAARIGPPSFKLGGRVVYYREDVLAWMDEQQAADAWTVDSAAVAG